MKDIGLSFLNQEESELRETASFLQTTFGKAKFNPSYLKWLYFENPEGWAIAVNARSRGAIIGHYATIPVSFQYRGSRLRAGWAIHACTAAKWRGAGVFTRMARCVHEENKSQSRQFIFAVTNRMSTPIYINRLGFSDFGQMSAHLGVGRAKLVAENPSLRRYWQNSSIKWRLASPNRKYFQARSGEIFTKIACGIHVVLENEKQFVTDLPRKGFPAWKPKLYLTSGGVLKYKRGSFYDLPQYLRPSPLHIIAKSISNQMPVDLVDRVVLQAFDLDFY